MMRIRGFVRDVQTSKLDRALPDVGARRQANPTFVWLDERCRACGAAATTAGMGLSLFRECKIDKFDGVHMCRP